MKKPIAASSKTASNSVMAWSDIIRRQGAEARAKQDKMLGIIRRALADLDLSKHSNLDLVLLHEWNQARCGCADPRERKLWEQALAKTRQEILNRLAKTGGTPR